MKLFLTLLLATTGALALRDLSKYQDRSVLCPHRVPIKTYERVPAGGSRITGGVESVPNSRPFIVGLFIDDLYFCGGSILSEFYLGPQC